MSHAPTLTVDQVISRAVPAPRRSTAADTLRATGSERLADLAQMQAVLDWQPLYLLAVDLDCFMWPEGRRKRGRRSPFPTAVLLAIEMGARATGSLASILSMLREEVIWDQLRAVWESRDETQDVPFPAAAPDRNHMRYWRERLFKTEGWSAHLQQRFQYYAVFQAKTLGNLNGGVEPDWTKPSLRHALYGDGTVITPLSDVTKHVNPVTGEIFYRGSRGAKPRLAPRLTDLSEDGKDDLRGLNMVSLSTWTKYGQVVLGTGYATGAEQWPALDLLDAVAGLAGGGANVLLWDRVFHGWLKDYAMAKHRIRVINKSVGDTSPQAKETEEEAETTQRMLADRALARMRSEARQDRRLADIPDQHWASLTKTQKKKQAAALKTYWLRQDLMKIYYSGAPQPLGVSLYPSTSASDDLRKTNRPTTKDFDVDRSKPRRFGSHTHTTATGTCTHEMWVDGGALHTVDLDPAEGHLVKVATAHSTSSTARRRAGGIWGTTETWRMPCPHGDFEITTQWNPQHTRFTPDTPEDVIRTPEDMVLNDLSPISRSDLQEFADIANFRNLAESFNSWYQRTLPRDGRAASLSVDGQELDLLAAACLRNALTWATHMDTAK